jgi:DNA-binding transcriptional LysR family regulator
MEWQQIIGFYHVVRLGSFTRAAACTYRTQSALSHQIRKLEQELECHLIERIGKKKLVLTLAGEKLYSFAKRIIAEHDLLISELGEIRGIKLGRVRIASPYNTLYYLLPRYISAYKSRHPMVELSILELPPINVLESLSNGEVDFGIAMEAALPKYLKIRRWKEGEYVLMVPENHELLNYSQISLQQVAEYPLILPPKYSNSSARQKLLDTLENEGIRYRIAMESSNAALSMKYVSLGVGISFCLAAEDLKKSRLPGLQSISMRHHFDSEYISMFKRKEKILTPAMEAFEKILFDESITNGFTSTSDG